MEVTLVITKGNLQICWQSVYLGTKMLWCR